MNSEVKSKEIQLAEARGIGVFRHGRWLIRDVDLRVDRGNIVSLIGPNGGGKTTAAKVLTGIIRPDKGTVTHAENLRIGYVPQKLQVNSTLPVSVRRIMQLTQKCSNQEISGALEEMDVLNLIDSPFQHLSGGEVQRVLFARAMVKKPDLLILDEPAQGLDNSGEANMYDHIAAVRDNYGCGVLLISHDLRVVMAKTDNFICLNHHICCTGTPDHISNPEEYERLFGEVAHNALALYHHAHDRRRNNSKDSVRQAS